MSEVLNVLHPLAETKIGQFEMPRFYQYVIGLNVSMKDLIVDQGFEGVHELLEVEEGLFLGESPESSDFLVQSASFTVLIDQINVVRGLDHLHKSDDVDVVLDGHQGVYLVLGALCEFGDLLKLPDLDTFDGHIHLGVDVGCLEHPAVLPLAYDFTERIIVDDLHHAKGGYILGDYK